MRMRMQMQIQMQNANANAIANANATATATVSTTAHPNNANANANANSNANATHIFFVWQGRKGLGSGKDLGKLELALMWRHDLVSSKYSSSIALGDRTNNNNNNDNGDDNYEPHGPFKDDVPTSTTSTGGAAKRGSNSRGRSGGNGNGEVLRTTDKHEVMAMFGLPRHLPNSNATRVDWNPFLS